MNIIFQNGKQISLLFASINEIYSVSEVKFFSLMIFGDLSKKLPTITIESYLGIYRQRLIFILKNMKHENVNPKVIEVVSELEFLSIALQG